MVTAEQLREIGERVRETNKMTASDFATFCYAMAESIERLEKEALAFEEFKKAMGIISPSLHDRETWKKMEGTS